LWGIAVREVTCPGCGEILGVPKELEGGPIRCGVCERVIDTTQSTPTARPRRSESRDEERSDERRPRDSGDRRDDDDAPRPRRRSREADDSDRPKKKSGCGVWVWIILIFGVLGVVCCGGGGFLVYKFAGDPKWEKFTPADARWSADMPGQPKMETKPLVGAVGDATYLTSQRMFGQEAYLVGYGDLAIGDEDLVNDAVMKESLDGILKGPMSPREVSRKNLKMAGVDAKELVVDVTDPQNGSGRMIVRVLIADNRIYTLIAVKMGKSGQNPDMAEKFFNSFVLTPKTPQKPPRKGPGLE